MAYAPALDLTTLFEVICDVCAPLCFACPHTKGRGLKARSSHCRTWQSGTGSQLFGLLEGRDHCLVDERRSSEGSQEAQKLRIEVRHPH